MTKQMDYYNRHKDEINAKRRLEGKTEGKTGKTGKTKKQVKHDVDSSYTLMVKRNDAVEPSLKLRLHRLQRTYAIINAVSENRLSALRLNDRLQNVKQWLGAGFRITMGDGWSLELEGIELINDARLPVAALEGQAYTLADNIAAALARQYGFLLAPGRTPPKLTEIELNVIQVTEKLKEIDKKGILELYSDPEGYKIWADWSFGIGGMESNNVEYMQRLANLSKDIAENDAWEQFKLNMVALSGKLNEYGTKLNVHIPVLEGMQLEQQQNQQLRQEMLRLIQALNGALEHSEPGEREPIRKSFWKRLLG